MPRKMGLNGALSFVRYMVTPAIAAEPLATATIPADADDIELEIEGEPSPTPEPAKPVTPVAQPQPAPVPPADTQDVLRQRQESARDVQARLAQAEQAYAQYLTDQEMLPEATARRIAQGQRGMYEQMLAREEQGQIQTQYVAARDGAAKEIAQKHGLTDWTMLQEFTSRKQMELFASQEARLQRLEKGRAERIPPNNLPNPRASGATTRVNADNIDQLYVEGKVPDDMYRRFLETGVVSRR